VRERRNAGRRRDGGAIGTAAWGLVAAVGWRTWTKIARRPIDALAIFSATALMLVIVVNATFLQSGSHPAPFFANPTPPPPRPMAAAPLAPKLMEPMPASAARAPANSRGPQPVSIRRNDQIAELISAYVGSPTRVTAVQHALSDFGYGQIKPSGILDEPTSAAIEKFEREHQMPVTGRLSDRLLSELSAATGRPLN
jgi:Putative peptidoglycan binding domain